MDAVKLPAGMRECPSETIRDRIDVGEAGWEVITTRDTHTIGVILTAVVAMLLAGRAAAAAVTLGDHDRALFLAGRAAAAAVRLEDHDRALFLAGRAAAAAVTLEDHVRAMLPAGRAVGG